MEPPSFPRRRKTAAERRAQRHRSEARFLQRALNGLNDLQAHRGGTLTRVGFALRDALTRLSAAIVVPHSLVLLGGSCLIVPMPIQRLSMKFQLMFQFYELIIVLMPVIIMSLPMLIPSPSQV